MPIVKNLAFGDDARKSLINGVNKIANAVKSRGLRLFHRQLRDKASH